MSRISVTSRASRMAEIFEAAAGALRGAVYVESPQACVCMRGYTYSCIHAYMHSILPYTLYTCICMYACMYVCMYVYIYIYVCVCVCAQTNTKPKLKSLTPKAAVAWRSFSSIDFTVLAVRLLMVAAS